MDIYPYKSRFSFPVVKCPPDASGLRFRATIITYRVSAITNNSSTRREMNSLQPCRPGIKSGKLKNNYVQTP
jgi:hypothetical protein